ncbi:glycine-rich domain-containing protein [Mucilaginibacter aquatilis]|uniref:glycine-rich domain-containing protein n=1 Tax=Mucilaginibacter aquatilis TaxID=1517760 RepID=UPI0018DE922B|nr:hypothetical protein [Mucilaginibacter aquatilis]
MMTETEQTLWRKIENFNLDDDESSSNFTARLSRENGWSSTYTKRVIEEYKKFIFLCCISPTGVTPSDAVDQAWHLHLTYTRSYWVDFCRDTLGQDVHHNPTKGGIAEAEKFDSYYTQSFKLYENKFDTQPPADIWLDNESRFSDINFQRINVSQYKPVKRSTISKMQFLLFVFVFIALCFIIPYIISNFDDLKIPLFFCGILLFISISIYATEKRQRQNENSAGGCGDSDDSSCGNDLHSGHSHEAHGHSDSGHGCSSGCSGCSSSGCSGCGGGCGGD